MTNWRPHNWHDIMNKPAAVVLEELNRDIVVEMALPLKEFRRRVDGIMFQLIENWCLCKYCQMYDPTNLNFGHWVTEFIAYVKSLRNFEIKGKINKQRTISKMFINDYDYNQPRKILEIIRDKFDDEKIDNMKKRNVVANSFVKSIDSLINLISTVDVSIADYVSVNFKFNM